MSEVSAEKDLTNVEPKPETKPEPESEVDLCNKRNQDEKCLYKKYESKKIKNLFVYIIGLYFQWKKS